MAEKDIDRILDLILNQLEKLNQNQEKLSEGVQNANLEISKVSGFRHVVADFKNWKEARDKIVNLDDLGKMKEFYTNNKEIGRDTEDEFKKLYEVIKELKDKAADYEKFKTKTMTVIAVISFLFATGMTILGWLVK